MTGSNTKKGTDYSAPFYKVAYTLFVLLSVYFFFISKDYSSAVSNFGIALIFDPFNQKQPFNDRPNWQKAWLIVHVLVLFTGFGWLIFR